jgi:hypothetical protein
LPNVTEASADPYEQDLTASCSGVCGTTFTWTLVAGGGDLPTGLTLGPCTNVATPAGLSCTLQGTVPPGTVEANTTYTFIVQLQDNAANVVLKTFELTVINTNP